MTTGGKIGLWLIGARGSVATTAVVGAAAVVRGIAPPAGMVTSTPPLSDVPLPPLDAFVVGGHDVVSTPLVKRAEALAAAGVFPSDVVAGVADTLLAADAEIALLPTGPAAPPPHELIVRISADLRAFRHRNDVDSMVVVNVASTEPPPTWDRPPADEQDLQTVVRAGWHRCPVSVVTALAAIDAGCAYVDFTPAAAVAVPAVVRAAAERGVAIAGRDGKTGETLLKTALAPMFADRALRILSWAGTNLLGGDDGARLADPRYAATKLLTKGQALESILPYEVPTQVHIDYLPDLGQWKTAWNHVHFEGFLGTRMQLQLTWQGCDSALAAPLVLDLARLVVHAQQHGADGLLRHLGFFFKDPVGCGEHRLERQYSMLCDWIGAL